MPRPARPWFRFYVEAVHDRKLRRLKPEYRWLFVACLAAARQSPMPGHLWISDRESMNLEDLADFSGMRMRMVEDGMRALLATGIVQWDDLAESWFVPNWNDRQYESDDVTARTRKHRKERSNDVPDPVPTSFPGTPPETEADTDPPNPPVTFEVDTSVYRLPEAKAQENVDNVRRLKAEHQGPAA